MVISYSLAIPQSSDVKILKKIGDPFHINEPLIEYSKPQEKIEINIINSSYFLKNIGDQIEKDEVVAKYQSGFLFKKTIEIRSSISGRIFELDNLGKVMVLGTNNKQVFCLPFSGKVSDLTQETMVLEFKGDEIVPLKIYGESFFAEAFWISKFDEEVDEKLIDVDFSGKILLGGHFSMTDLNKALACGVRGVIAGNISSSVLAEFDNLKKYSFLGSDSERLLSIAFLGEDQLLKFAHLKDNHGLYFDGIQGKIIIPHG
jgi:hypothetical protein